MASLETSSLKSQGRRTLFCTLGASINLTSGYYSQSNGQAERVNQTITLRCVAAQHLAFWSSFLPRVEYSNSSLVLATARMIPFMDFLGYQSPLFCTPLCSPRGRSTVTAPQPCPMCWARRSGSLRGIFFSKSTPRNWLLASWGPLWTTGSSLINMHPTFHISWIKPVSKSHFGPPFEPLTTPRVIESGSTYAVHSVLHLGQ